MTSTSGSTPAQAGPRVPGAPGLPRSLVAHPAYGPLPGLLLILTVVTGVVDSISILSLGRVFVANMTGNVVFAGFAIVGAPGFSLSASLFALAGFLAGAFGPAITDALAAVLATAMGIQNAVARKLAVPDLTTTVLTMTLTGIGADLRAVLGGAARSTARADLTRRLLAIGAMLAGALAGASLTLYVSPVSALALALSLLAVTAAAAMAAAARPAPWRTPPPKAK